MFSIANFSILAILADEAINFDVARFHLELILGAGSIISIVVGFIVYLKNTFTKITFELKSLVETDKTLLNKDIEFEKELKKVIMEIAKVKTGSNEDLKEFTNLCVKRHTDLTTSFEKKVENFIESSKDSFERIYDLIEEKERTRELRFRDFDIKIDNITNFLMNNSKKLK